LKLQTSADKGHNRTINQLSGILQPWYLPEWLIQQPPGMVFPCRAGCNTGGDNPPVCQVALVAARGPKALTRDLQGGVSVPAPVNTPPQSGLQHPPRALPDTHAPRLSDKSTPR